MTHPKLLQVFYHWADPRRDDDCCETSLEDNDLAWFDDLDTLAADPFGEFARYHKAHTGRTHPTTNLAWAHLLFDDGSERYAKNPAYRKSRDDDDDWRRERAMEAGMAFGCDGFNDEMGWGIDHED